MSGDKDRLFELRAINRTLSIAHAEKIDHYLNEVIRTKNRRKMWIAIDGSRMQNEIAEESGVSQRAVSGFLSTLSDAGLIEYKQLKPPRKIIDHIPSKWLTTIGEEQGG